LSGVREPSSRGKLAVVDIIRSAAPPWDRRSSHLFDSYHASEGPKVGVGDPWMLLLYSLEENACVLKASIGGVASFSFIAHTGTI
jgi:hypothetical protein